MTQGLTLGILGVGHLSVSLVTGLMRAGWGQDRLILSPRGQSAALSKRFGIGVADSNAALVTQSDIVLLAVRPGDAVAAVADLPWRVDQLLLSACAGVTIDALSEVAGAARIVRIMPLTAAELGASPTLVFPMLPPVAPVLAAFGPAIAVDSEEQFEAATVSAAIYGWAQALIERAAGWTGAQGVAPPAARALVAQSFVAAGRMMAEQDAPMEALLTGLVTPGGITEAGLRHLDAAGVFAAWDGACDVVLDRLRG